MAFENLPTITAVTAGRADVVKTAEDLDRERKDELHRRGVAHFRIAAQSEEINRAEMLEAFDFFSGRHWDEKEITERFNNGKQPSLSIDRLKPSIKRVVNHYRKNPIECRAIPAGNGGSKAGAQIITDIFRFIDNASRADIHIEGAYEDASIAGLSWYCLGVDWDGPRTFNRKIVVGSVDSPFRIYRDPEAKEFDFSDMRYCFETGDWSHEAYTLKWPKSQLASLASFTGIGDNLFQGDWFPEGRIRTAKYWYVETKVTSIAELPDGTVIDADKVPEGIKPVQFRDDEENTVKVATMNGVEILDETVFDAEWIPWIPVIADKVLVDGRRIMRGMVFDAIDASKLLDYMISKLALVVGLAPISPLTAPAGAIEGYEAMWEDANRVPRGVLPYNQMDISTGQKFDPPRRLDANPEIGAIMSGIALAVDNIKAQLDFYEASLGDQGPEISGKAILARQAAADAGHFNYVDNLARARQHEARIKLALIPKVMNRDQIIMISDPDGDERRLEITAGADGIPEARLSNKIEEVFKLDATKYQIQVSVGPTFQTRRQESLQFLMELARMFPEAMTRALPTLIRSTDAPEAEKIANLLDPQAGQDQKVPPQVVQQMKQQGQLVELLTKSLHQLQDKLDTQAVMMEAKERIAAHADETAIITTAMKVKSADAQALMTAEIDQLNAVEERRVAAEEKAAESAAGAAQPATAGTPSQ